jgi:RNA polymerase sigma-70 factor, ECF subfamily
MLAFVMDAAELADVIARARRREPAAFDALVTAYGDRLYGYFYRLTGSRHDAEDLLQEVFIRLVRMIGRYQHDGRFEGWLFRIATNLVRDRVRRSKTGRPAADSSGARGARGEAESMGERPDPAAERPSASLERAENIDRLQQAIGELPEAEREVILLRHFAQLSFKEIAEQMGTPLGTALARAHRGLAKLRELMADETTGLV